LPILLPEFNKYFVFDATLVLFEGFRRQRQEEQKHTNNAHSVGDQINDYTNLHRQEESQRTGNYERFVNAYYNVSTIFYEWAWGSSFHFAPRRPYETFQGAILRHELRLADRLRLKEGSKVLDVGCGIGGPLFNIARTTGAHITGLNNNAYQVSRANTLLKEKGIKNCNFVKGDFCQMDFAKDNTYDACYAIESTCHAPKREDVFKQINRTLKPGGLFGTYEWVLTDKHDPSNKEHMQAAKNVEIGNGLPTTTSYEVVLDALRDSGFEVLEYEDFFANRSKEDMPWWRDLEGSYWRPFSTFQFLPLGKFLYFNILTLFEKIKLAPEGTSKVSQMLHVGADGLVAGGKMGTFTPGFFFLARKLTEK